MSVLAHVVLRSLGGDDVVAIIVVHHDAASQPTFLREFEYFGQELKMERVHLK